MNPDGDARKKEVEKSCSCGCSHEAHGEAEPSWPFSRRGFLQGVSCGAVGVALGGLSAAAAAEDDLAPPAAKPLRVKPILAYEIQPHQPHNSYRGYGGVDTMDKVNEEVKRIESELKRLAEQSDFAVEFLPVAAVDTDAKAQEAAATDCDVLLVYPSGGSTLYKIAESKTPAVLFIRHKSGPYYLWHEIAHWRLLRNNDDTFVPLAITLDDIVVDKYDEVQWRLRSLYGLKNAKGTKMLAIGELAAYCKPGQETGPPHAKEVWGYQFEIISVEDFTKRLADARANAKVVEAVQRQTKDLLAQPNVTLETEEKFVFNSFMALRVAKQIMKEVGATNFGFAYCMSRRFIEMLDTPPCLALAMANDEGYTAYCHTDLTHTLPGVLLHWISGKPTFVANSHYPHDGMFTVAHCAAPRKMNGKDCEPTRIMTHFESDYGAATKIEYTKGQVVTAIIPNLHCTKWQGFRGKILGSPSHAACRSQMDILVDGDVKKILAEQQGFHTQVCYGDYLREVGYALGKLKKIEWQNFSA
jgi:hypothetical protein